MAIDRPYFRIYRPSLDPYRNNKDGYLWDNRYAKDVRELALSYHLLEKDLQTLFEYVDPADANLSVYSHRTYELLLRGATEFEMYCKRILEAHGQPHKNIKDYFLVNQATKWADYAVVIPSWRNQAKLLKPFQTWEAATFAPLPWYQAYNNVKHDRSRNFDQASLENALLAISAVLISFSSQFTLFQLSPYQSHSGVLTTKTQTDTELITFQIADNSMFGLCEPEWSNDEKYDFDWQKLFSEENPFEQFPFRQ